MKILFNGYKTENKGHKLHHGGVRNFTNNLANYLATTKHQCVSLIISGKKKKDNKYRLKITKSGHIETYDLNLRINSADVFSTTKAQMPVSVKQPIKTIAQILTQAAPDVILLNGFGLSNWLILKAAHQAGIPVVACHHGIWHKEIGFLPNKPRRATLNLLKKMERDITQLSSREIFLNDFSFQEYCKIVTKVPSHKAIIIPLPYNPIFLNSSLKHKTSKVKQKKIGFVGRWDPIKNPEAVLELAKQSSQKKLPWKFHAVVKMYADYQQIAKHQQEFINRINVIDQLAPQKLKQFYRKMDILVLPSRFDVSPTVVLEAALQGVGTAISPNVGWIKDYKKFGANDWIIDYSNIPNVLIKLEKLLNKKFPTKLAQHLKTTHHPKHIFKRYLQLLTNTAYENRTNLL
jgi:glycosyltransferase involved in cell wall biosynthesis